MGKRNLHPSIYAAAKQVQDSLTAQTKCTRCDGNGYMDRSDWRVTEADGRRVCFACHGRGSCHRRSVSPWRMRYRVVSMITPLVRRGDVSGIVQMMEKTRAAYPEYLPILVDVYGRALKAACEKKANSDV